jgi:tetratricopeptide (TPR) repeat protein
MQSRSPGWHYSQQGQIAMSQDKWDEAEEILTVAVELDPDLSEAFSRRGHVRLKQNKTNEAGADFREAARLDPYDGQAVTGLGIVLAMEGKFDEALEMVLGAADRFPDDLIYAYNTACVYGRALERLEKEEASSARDDRIADYRGQALRHLGTSIRLGFEDFPLMRTDPDLEPLRKLPEFQKLLPEEKPGETPPPPAETAESRE